MAEKWGRRRAISIHCSSCAALLHFGYDTSRTRRGASFWRRYLFASKQNSRIVSFLFLLCGRRALLARAWVPSSRHCPITPSLPTAPLHELSNHSPTNVDPPPPTHTQHANKQPFYPSHHQPCVSSPPPPWSLPSPPRCLPPSPRYVLGNKNASCRTSRAFSTVALRL